MNTEGILVLKQTMGYERCRLVKARVKTGKVLDLGCGTGQNLLLISDKIEKGIGIDLSEERLSIARKLAQKNSLKNILFENKSVLSNNLQKDSFDWIICTEVIEHIKEDDLLLDNIRDWLKLGGKAVVSTPSKKMFTKINEKLRNYVGEPEHVKEGYTIEELKKKLEKRGFQIIEAGYYGQFFSTFIHYFSSLFAKRRNVKIERGEPNLLIYKIYKILWPIMYIISRLDYLIPRKTEGGFLFLIAEKKSPS
jgi:2-polyprenyl-3-methyl-5-hydroxy-6-metoxy-1,4-benzoquinol methylase